MPRHTEGNVADCAAQPLTHLPNVIYISCVTFKLESNFIKKKLNLHGGLWHIKEVGSRLAVLWQRFYQHTQTTLGRMFSVI